MERADLYNQVFKQINFIENPLPPGDYEKCRFENCNFSGNLSKIIFIDCIFSDCDLSNVKLNDTAFRNAQFAQCKMLGLHFENCHPFLLEMSFNNCVLNHASFYQLKLKKTAFTSCMLKEVDFTGADLTAANFDQADLSGAIFDQTILEQADFRNARHFIIHPEINRIRKARFSADALAGLLTQYDISIE